MKQKILKLLAAPALLLAAGITLSGCVKDIDGTNANYGEKKQEITDNLGTVDAAWTGYVEYWAGNIEKAEKQSHIELQIFSSTRLDMTTVDGAITFYKLTANTEDSSYYPMHDGELTKTFVSSNIYYNNGKNYNLNTNYNEEGMRTCIKYDVDTESVTTNKIAVIVDATKLKDVFGNLVLNLDGNYKAGQESDNWITYIGVNKQSDGTTNTTPINNSYSEDFRRQYIPVHAESITANMDTTTGKVTFTVPLYTNNQAGTEYDQTLASALGQTFVLRTKGLEESAYKDNALEWAYETGTYKATSAVLPYGTSYSLVMTMTDFTAPEWITKAYGHPGFTDIYAKGTKMEVKTGESNVVTEQPDYIVDDPSDPANSGDSWTVGAYDEDDIGNYQRSLLNVSLNNTQISRKWISGYFDDNDIWHDGYYIYTDYYRWTVTPATGVKLKSYEDFIVTGENYNKLETKISYVKNSDDTIRTIYIDVIPPVIRGVPILWVGSGTVLEENTAYPKQVKFGSPFKNSLMGDASGYIPLAN